MMTEPGEPLEERTARRLQDMELYSLMVVARKEHADRHRLVGDCLEKAAVQGLDGKLTGQENSTDPRLSS